MKGRGHAWRREGLYVVDGHLRTWHCVQTEQSILLELEYKSHHNETDNNIVWSLCSQTAEELFF